MIRSSQRLWYWGSTQFLVLGMTLFVGWAGLVRCWGVEGKSNRPSTAPSETASSAKAGVEGKSDDSPWADQIKEITFDDLKLDLKKGKEYDASLLTEKVKQLVGKHVRIRGFLYPSFKQSGITQFVLVYDDCPPVDNCIIVEMVPPNTIDYVVHAIDVEGIFSIRELIAPDGKVHAIYHMDGKEVRLVPGVRAPRSKCGC
jgi:hypothetical protein